MILKFSMEFVWFFMYIHQKGRSTYRTENKNKIKKILIQGLFVTDCELVMTFLISFCARGSYGFFFSIGIYDWLILNWFDYTKFFFFISFSLFAISRVVLFIFGEFFFHGNFFFSTFKYLQFKLKNCFFGIKFK